MGSQQATSDAESGDLDAVISRVRNDSDGDVNQGHSVNPRDLLSRLLDYIEEQAKDIDPRVFRLANAKGFLKRRAGMSRSLLNAPGRRLR